MLIAGFDTETTGLEPGDHRFVEVYVGLYDLTSRKLVGEYLQRIDPQRSIQAEAQRVHGISAHDLIGMPTWDITGPELRRELDQAELIVAHNGESFDMPFLNYELKRIKQDPILTALADTMKLARWATPIGKLPTLGELCFACGVDYDTSKAHAASYDVHVMMECFFRGLDWGFYPKPPAPAETAVAA